jgi:hypothetical protein
MKNVTHPITESIGMKLNFGSNIISNISGILTVEGENQIIFEIGDEGQPLLTMNIYNSKGKQIARISRNTWAFNNEDRFETTITPASLKLIDKTYGHCVIEVNVVEGHIVQIPHGKFYTHYGLLVEVTPSLYRIGGVEVKGNIIDACGKAFVVG